MAAPFEAYVFKHSSLGDLKGRLTYQRHKTEVVQFRSVPFATIPERFKPSVISDGIPEHFDHRPKGDFTQYGNACPHLTQPHGPYGGPLPDQWEMTYDDGSCLNLSISAPKDVLDATNGEHTPKLPVMVYIHGGGFVEGAGHTSTLQETMRMAALSLDDGEPVVLINIGYRLNWFGFLNCKDLLDESEEELGRPFFNVGLWDQRNALIWLQRYVAGFGGDPSNITVYGESAGSVSIFCHLCADAPLFKRAIVMSGTMAVTPTQPLEMYEQRYQELLQHLGIEAGTRQERLKALRSASSEKLVDAIIPLRAFLTTPYCGPENAFFSHNLLPLATEASVIGKDHWIDSIMIGDCFFEGYILYAYTQNLAQSTFVDVLRNAFGQSHADELLTQYSIDPSQPMDSNLFWSRCMILLGDLLLSEPIDRAAAALAPHKPTYRYTICLSNPFPGSANSFVSGHHFVDILYLFMTLTERYPTRRDNFFARQAETIARKWIAFANGTEPWHVHTPGSREIAIFDDICGMEVRTQDDDARRSQKDIWGERWYEGWEKIKEVLEGIDPDVTPGKTLGERIVAARWKIYGGLVGAMQGAPDTELAK